MNKKILIPILVFILLIIGVIVLFFSPIGAKFVKNYVLSRVEILSDFNIKQFKYDINSFSMILEKENNKIDLVGDLFPFDASYEADLNDISKLNQEFRGQIKSSGIIKYTGYTNINGSALFADGFANIRLQCTDKCIGVLNGKEFNTEKLFSMLKIDIPLKGINTLNLTIKNNGVNFYSKFIGGFFYKDLVLKKIELITDGMVKNRQNYNINIHGYGKDFKLNMKLTDNNSHLNILGNIKIDLSKLRSILLYPIKGIDTIKFFYDSLGGVFKFDSENYSGFYENNLLNINLNNLSSKNFFEYLNLSPFVISKINGAIIIDTKNKEGKFDLVSNSCKVIKNKIISFIESKIRKKIDSLNVAFIKGNFDKNRVIFNILCKSDQILVSIQNGIYFYNGKYSFNVEVVVNNNYKYIFKVKNGNVSLVKTIKSYKVTNEVLVY